MIGTYLNYQNFQKPSKYDAEYVDKNKKYQYFSKKVADVSKCDKMTVKMTKNHQKLVRT